MSRQPSKDRRLVKVLTALRAHGGPVRSPLYRWMRQQHDPLAAAFTEIPPAWGPLSAELAAVGLTDADGKPPTATSARQTWYRVRRDVARARDRAAAKVAALAPDEIAPAVHAVTPPATGDDPPARSRPGMVLDIRPARAATGAPPVVAPAAAAASTRDGASATGAVPPVAGPSAPAPVTPATESAAEQLRRLLSTIDAGKVPLPKVM